MKDITLRITGKTISSTEEQAQDDVLQFTTSAKLMRRGKITCLSYDETEISGMEGCKTLITVSEKKVKMKREGMALGAATIMEFVSGKRFEGLYETPYGPVGMEILTNSISGMDLEDGKLSIDYSVSLHGLMSSRQLLDIEILN